MRFGNLSVAWLVAGAVLTGVAAHFVTVPIAPWIMLTLLLRAARTLPARWSLPALGLALYAALAIGNRGIIPVPGLPYFLVILGVTLGTLFPFVADRFVGRGLSERLPAVSTLVFPIAWVSVELVNARLTPSATWGWIGYAIRNHFDAFGVHHFAGIAFLIAWFASVVNEVWARGFARDAARDPCLDPGLVLLGGPCG